MKTVRVALVGVGSVQRCLLQILYDKQDQLKKEYGLYFLVMAIADSSGVAVNADGFDPIDILKHKQSGKRISNYQGYRDDMSITDVIGVYDCDLIFEASPVDLKTGGTGLKICRKALSMGVSVVLANKAPLVLAFKELHQLADSGSSAFKYSATVCGGLPVLNIGRRDFPVGDILELKGIFNSTCNFILDSMAKGDSFDAALKEAQERGIAETDPSLDIEGWDTANKLLIIANTIMGADIGLDDIEVSGIKHIKPDYILAEKAKGNAVKLVASAKDGKFSVGPTAIAQSEFLAQCTGWEMAIEIHTDIFGINYFKLWEREPIPTAGSMLRDAIHIFSDKAH